MKPITALIALFSLSALACASAPPIPPLPIPEPGDPLVIEPGPMKPEPEPEPEPRPGASECSADTDCSAGEQCVQVEIPACDVCDGFYVVRQCQPVEDDTCPKHVNCMPPRDCSDLAELRKRCPNTMPVW